MENKNVETIEIKEHRLVRPIVFVEKENPNGKRVRIIQQAATVDVNGCEIAFAMPNPISLFISISKKEYNSAKNIYADLIKPKLKQGATLYISEEQTSLLLDYFEHIQTSIIAIYSAIEALANIAIPEDYKMSKLNNKGVEEIWTKENVKRWSQTTEKVGKIIPEVLNIDTPKNMPFWEDFKRLEEIRNDIIHQKHAAYDSHNIETKFLSVLLSDKVFSYVKAGFLLITYFCENNKTETYFPIMDKAYPIEPVEVEDWDNYFSWVPFKNMT